MKTHQAWLLAPLLLLGACAVEPRVTVDAASPARFSGYGTYSWLARPGAGLAQQQRIVDGVDAQLQARGWRKAERGDVSISASMTTVQQQSLTTFYDTSLYANWGWRIMPGRTVVDTYQFGTLAVDLFDASTRRAIWHGKATAAITGNSEKTAVLMAQALDRMFTGFPFSDAANRHEGNTAMGKDGLLAVLPLGEPESEDRVLVQP
jgi:hypothetical protein